VRLPYLDCEQELKIKMNKITSPRIDLFNFICKYNLLPQK
jgi:hypothetical protein